MNQNQDNETNIKEHNLIKNVFLDTNIFSSAKFNYNSGNLYNFLENAKEHSIQVYITSVVETEIKKQIKHVSQKHHEAIYNAILNGAIKYDMEFTRGNDFCDYMESRLLELFGNMIENYDIKIIPCSLNVDDTDLLMDMHYDIKPPFTKDKKSEFKDAISLINILNFIRKKDGWHNTIFATLDNGCILFCKKNEMKYCRHISKISDLILSQNDHDKFIEKNRDTISQYLRAYFNDRKIDYCIESNLWNSEDFVDIRDDKIIINNIELIDFYINNIENAGDYNDTIKIIDVSVNIKVDFEITTYPYGDDDTVFHDKEDGCDQWFYCQYIETTFIETVLFENKGFTIYYSVKDGKIDSIEQNDLIEISIEGYIGDYRQREGSFDSILIDNDEDF